jgi:hypothetical protein
MEHKSAKQLIAEMETLKAQLALTRCRCCGRPLNIYTQPGLHAASPTYQYGTCFNENCERYTITREVNDLYSLTDAQMAQFKQAIANRDVA